MKSIYYFTEESMSFDHEDSKLGAIGNFRVLKRP